MRFGFLVNESRPDAIVGAKEAVEWLHERGHVVVATASLAQEIGAEAVEREALGSCDLAVSFGGDGTMMRAAHACSESGVPILGVNYGRFGFVAPCAAADVVRHLEAFLAGRGEIEERMMLQADLYRGANVVTSMHSLNEVSLQRSSAPMLTTRVKVDERVLTTYPADGVLVATPTGSTGYNLSAGGPVVHPSVQAMILVAVAPHTLSARPLILGADSVVTLELVQPKEAAVTIDGQSGISAFAGDRVVVTRSPRRARLFLLERDDFLQKLSDKLFWSKGMVE
ncbi:MAG: NAD(+)/NADH kinase [Fimbriimonadaceae bacterium]